MSSIKIKIIKRYFSKFLNYLFYIAGGLFFAITFNVMTIMPELKPSDISHLSSQNIQFSLSVWQFLFWLPIIGGLVLTLVEGLLTNGRLIRKEK